MVRVKFRTKHISVVSKVAVKFHEAKPSKNCHFRNNTGEIYPTFHNQICYHRLII